MSKISSLSSRETPVLKRVKSINQRLVKILNHKMFKGYRNIKQNKEYFVSPPKYFNNLFWENRIIDPFDDCYNIEYKRKNLSSLNNKDLSSILLIKNISNKNMGNQVTIQKNSNTLKKLSNTPKKRNNFRRKQNIKVSKRHNNDKYFYFSSNSSLIRNNMDDDKEKKLNLYKTIFSDINEKGLYNDIPFFSIEKIHKINNIKKKKKFVYLPSEEERINDLQFLYKVSHKMPVKKLDFRNKYNIKSALHRNKSYLENNASKPLRHNIQSAKISINRLYLNNNKSELFVSTNFGNNNNNEPKLDNSNLNDNREDDYINFSYLYNDIIKNIKNENEKKSRNVKLIKSKSACSLINGKEYNIKNKTKKTSSTNNSNFPTKDRFINDQIFVDFMNYKKEQFEKLKKLIEY